MNSNKIHFEGLNGLRFFSASAVVFSHIELIKMAFGYSHSWDHPVFFYLGGIAVIFFFVLSGFLITFLLLEEKRNTQTINVKNFYIILRIWPLYYLIVIIGFFILPHFSSIKINYLELNFQKNYYHMLFLYLLILPNLATALYGHVPHIGHLWTIGVEEQFYILWPLIIKKIKNNILSFLLVFIFIVISIKALVLFLFLFYQPKNYSFLFHLKEFMAGFKIECMAIGAIGAYLYWSKSILLRFIYHPFLHILAWCSIPLLIFYTPHWAQDANHLIYSLSFIIIILNVSTNKNSFLKLENSVLNYFGKISYGIYMYHFMLIPIVLFLLKKINIDINSTEGNFYLYSLSFLSTFMVSIISYIFFEKKFLNYKNKFSVIPSKM